MLSSFAGLILFPSGHARISCIAKGMRLFAMEQRVGLCHIIDIGCGGHNGMGQTGIGIHTNMGLHAEVSLVAFL